MDNWLASLTGWFVGLVTSIFTALVTWIHDAVLWLFDGIVSAAAALIAAIPAPGFLSSYSIIGLLNFLPAYPRWVLSQLPIGTALAIILAGVVFRLTRKFFTVGQW